MLKHCFFWGFFYNKNEYYSVQARLFFLFSMEQRPEFFSSIGWPDYLFYLQKLQDHHIMPLKETYSGLDHGW
jgi:hypothetical protein